jgi:SAM-dependent methyltransferase
MDVAGAVLDGGEARRMRFDVASKHLREDVHGAYGEFPLAGLLQILEHPEVAAVLLAAEEVVGHAEGSVDDAEKISRAAAFHPEQDCDPEEDEECAIQETTNAFQPSFVDVGSGAGRLILAAATMRPWRSVIGVEASATLAGVASGAIAKLEAECVLPPGAVRSIHADATLGGGDVECLFDAEGCPEDPAGSGDGGDIVGAASALAGADLILAYSTAFPSPDGLRLPELSAALAAVMRPGALAVTTDKWLVGDRFEFVDMLLVQGEEGPEDQIRAFLWRARGEVPVASAKQDERGRSGVAVVAETLARIREEWMDEEDACSQNPEACAAMLESLESELAVIEGVGEMDEEEAEDDAKGGE